MFKDHLGHITVCGEGRTARRGQTNFLICRIRADLIGKIGKNELYFFPRCRAPFSAHSYIPQVVLERGPKLCFLILNPSGRTVHSTIPNFRAQKMDIQGTRSELWLHLNIQRPRH